MPNVSVCSTWRREDTTEDVTLVEFMDRWSPYLDGPGTLIDQPFAPRLNEGMIRADLVEREVVGFARQQPVPRSLDRNAHAPDRVLGMPSAKTMSDADAPEYRTLRRPPTRGGFRRVVAPGSPTTNYRSCGTPTSCTDPAPKAAPTRTCMAMTEFRAAVSARSPRQHRSCSKAALRPGVTIDEDVTPWDEIEHRS